MKRPTEGAHSSKIGIRRILPLCVENFMSGRDSDAHEDSLGVSREWRNEQACRLLFWIQALDF